MLNPYLITWLPDLFPFLSSATSGGLLVQHLRKVGIHILFMLQAASEHNPRVVPFPASIWTKRFVITSSSDADFLSCLPILLHHVSSSMESGQAGCISNAIDFILLDFN